MSLVETISGRIAASFLNYLHLGSWIDTRMNSVLSGRETKEYESVETFWNEVADGSVKHGDRVRFRDAFVSDWVPRSPGEIWRSERNDPKMQSNIIRGTDVDLQKLRKGEGLVGLESSVSGGMHSGLGVVRFPLTNDPLATTVLSATTNDAWCTDLGVPLVVSNSVYDGFLAKREKFNSVTANFEAVIDFRRNSVFTEETFRSIGAKTDMDFLRGTMTPLDLPSVVLRLASPLDVIFGSHNECPPGFLWAILRGWRTHDVTFFVPASGSDQDLRIEQTEIEPEWHYSALLARTPLEEAAKIDSTAHSFRLGSIPTFISQRPIELARGIERIEVLTEFDGIRRRFTNAIPISNSPLSNQTSQAMISRCLNDLHRNAILEETSDKTSKSPD